VTKNALSKSKGDIVINKELHTLLPAIVLLPILLVAGCGTSAPFESRGLPDKDWPKKRVMVMPATDLTGIPLDEIIDTVSEELSEILRKTGFFTVYHHKKPREFLSFKPGEPVDPELMREARGMGINAIVFETVNPLETNSVKSGIWTSGKRAQRVTLSINIDMVDVNRGTVLLSKEIADNITVPGEEPEKEKEKSADVETKKMALKECLPHMLEKAAMAASLSLNREVWTGRIQSSDKKGIIINAGRDAGLRPGIVFEVFGEGESITSFRGQTYRLPGPKVGEIRTVGIETRHSMAEPTTGTDFKTGQIVRVKD